MRPETTERRSICVDRLKRVALPILRSFQITPAEAEDVFQDACLHALERESEIRCLDTWFAQTVRNGCRRRVRRGRNHSVPFESLVGTAREPQVDPRERVALEVKELLARLQRRQAALLWLFYCVGASVDEVSEALRGSPASVKNQLLRARQAARQLVTAEASAA